MLTGLLELFVASIVTSLAAAMVARLVTTERGPFAVFVRLRMARDRLLDLGYVGRELHELFSCPYCLSVWLCFIGSLIVGNLWVSLTSPVLAWTWIEISGTGEPDNSI